MAGAAMRGRGHGFGVAVAAMSIAAIPFVTGNAFYLKVVFLIGVNYLAAVGLNVLVGYAGQKSLGHAGLFAVGAYTAALLTARLGWNPWVAFAASGLMAGCFGVLIALPALRVQGPALAMVTIGFGIVVERVVTEWQDVFAGQQGIYGVVAPSIGGRPLTDAQWVWFVGAIAVVAHLLIRGLLRGKYGRAFKAMSTAEVAAESVGISVYRMKVLAFAISAVTCGLAGAMVAQQNQFISSDFITFNLSIFFLLIVLFGGASVYGPLVGAIVLTLLDAFMARWPDVQHFAYGALLLFALYVMPNGLAGALHGFAARFVPRRSPAIHRSSGSGWRLDRVASSRPDAPLLEATGLFKAYGGVIPVCDVDLALTAGHVHSLIGPNGAGKTTLLNILSGIVRADRGDVVFAGESIARRPPNGIARLGIGRTFQNLKLFANLSVVENVRVGLHRSMAVGVAGYLLGSPASRRVEAVAATEALELLDFVGLLADADARAGGLPYASQRRLEIARALATHPRLLLLDEPAAGLNPTETGALVELIARIRASGVTILLIEHHMDIVMTVSDHVIVLDYGRKIAEGKPADIQCDPRVIAAYLGTEEADADEHGPDAEPDVG